ncbi:hypothetical protein P8452_57159 [Trifolium repens]|nr:hypothetical protein P8452_57159 [Trifolium repens]
MADRFFPNDLPPFMEETTLEEATSSQTPTPHSLTSLLSLPYTTLTSKLQAAAFHFKQSVVNETWGSSMNRVKDYTLYTGVLGTAYLVFKAYQVTKNVDDLNLCYLFNSSDKT